jgi:transketolase
MSTIKPLDEITLHNAIKRTGCIVTAEEHNVLTGLGSAVGLYAAEHGDCIIRRVGIPDVFGESGESEELMVKYGLTSARIVETAEEAIRRRQ